MTLKTGDVDPVGEGVSEMRIFIGPGYRLYYTIRQDKIILLLCGGDKSTQEKDIKKAKEIAGQTMAEVYSKIGIKSYH